MSTDRQIEANRRNAQKSTGPRTPEGKKEVSSNALRHGLTGREILMPYEKLEDFESFFAELYSSLNPQGGMEEALAEKIAIDSWRLRRIPVLETSIYRRGYQDLIVNEAANEVRKYTGPSVKETLTASVTIDERSITNPRAHKNAVKKLEDERAKLAESTFLAIQILENSASTFSNLWRQETALSRSIQRTLHELQRLQASRSGNQVPAPAVVDVNLDMTSAHPDDDE